MIKIYINCIYFLFIYRISVIFGVLEAVSKRFCSIKLVLDFFNLLVEFNLE